MSFDVDTLVRTTTGETGLSDFGSADFREGLEVFLDSLGREAEIAEHRRDRLRSWLERLLRNRLWFIKDVTDHPEILEEKLGEPVVISTLPRTSSTKLHRQLAASGDFQTLSFWQVHMPSRIPGEPDGGAVRRRAETQEYERWMYEVSPGILTGHPQFTDEAEEDQWLMEAAFRHPIFFGMFEVPSYLHWLMTSDMTPAFVNLRHQLQYIQWQTGRRDRPWLIKSPTHFGAEPFLEAVFGKIKVVVSHRDPAKCIPSISLAAEAVRNLYSERRNRADHVAAMTTMFAQAADLHLDWRARTHAPILDLAFRDITRDGLAAAETVYDFLGMSASPEAEARMRAWEQDNGRDKHGNAAYSAAMFETTEAEIRRPFGRYLEAFSAYV